MSQLRYNMEMSQTNPNAIIVCGPNGVGKTTLAMEYQKIHPFKYLGADAIAYELNAKAPSLVKIQAGRLFIDKVSQHISSGDDLIIETTLSGIGFQRVIQQLNKARYHIILSFVFLQSPEACVARVQERTLTGGHFVPTEDVKRRYYRAKLNFWYRYKQLVNQWYLLYNSNSTFHEICSGANEQQTIADENLFQLFLENLKQENIHGH